MGGRPVFSGIWALHHHGSLPWLQRHRSRAHRARDARGQRYDGGEAMSLTEREMIRRLAGAVLLLTDREHPAAYEAVTAVLRALDSQEAAPEPPPLEHGSGD